MCCTADISPILTNNALVCYLKKCVTYYMAYPMAANLL